MKTLLFIEPCLSSHLLVKKAQENGYSTIVVTANSDSRKIPSEVLEKVDHLIVIDTNNDDAVLQEIQKIKEKIKIDAVIPGAEYYVPLTAKISSFLGKRGLSPEAALGARRKDFMRERLKLHSVQIPRYFKVNNEYTLKEALHELGYPCILKPVDLAGSIGVKKVSNYDEALTALKAIIGHDGMDPAWGNRRIEPIALVEEYIEGKEYSVEGFVQDKVSHIVSITEKILSPEPDFVEVGHVVSPIFDPELFEKIDPYIKEVVNALDLAWGPFHAEVRMSPKGPVLMEIAMRLAGDYIPKLIEYATGIDYYLNTFFLLSGDELKLGKTKSLFSGITFFFKPEVSKIRSIDYFNTLNSNECVMETKSYYKEGEEVPHLPLEKHKLGYAIIVDKNRDTLLEKMNFLEDNAEFR